MNKITKLVLPVAGLGKRLLPLTLTTPKNLVPVCGRPLLEYVLEEAVLSGIRYVILIINPGQRPAFVNYIKTSKKNFPGLRFRLCEQPTPGGNGHAIVQAYNLIGKEPFAVRFCDDIIVAKKPILLSLIGLFGVYHSPVLLLERVKKSLVSRFGVVAVRKIKKNDKENRRLHLITKIVEKPRPNDAPSNLTIVGGYILTPAILRNLKSVADTLPVIADDALPLAVALQIELILGGRILGWEFAGRRLDCGTIEKLKKAEEVLAGQL